MNMENDIIGAIWPSIPITDTQRERLGEHVTAMPMLTEEEISNEIDSDVEPDVSPVTPPQPSTPARTRVNPISIYTDVTEIRRLFNGDRYGSNVDFSPWFNRLFVQSLPSDYFISYSYSKLLPYFSLVNFNALASQNRNNPYNFPKIEEQELFCPIPISSVYGRWKRSSEVAHTICNIDECHTSNAVNIRYRDENGNIVNKPIFLSSHFIYTYRSANIENARSLSIPRDEAPIVLMSLCTSRDYEMFNEFSLNRSILLVNSDPQYRDIVKPFNKYIKYYREAGVKNLLYSENPNHYLFPDVNIKRNVFSKAKLDEIIARIINGIEENNKQQT